MLQQEVILGMSPAILILISFTRFPEIKTNNFSSIQPQDERKVETSRQIKIINI